MTSIILLFVSISSNILIIIGISFMYQMNKKIKELNKEIEISKKENSEIRNSYIETNNIMKQSLDIVSIQMAETLRYLNKKVH